MPAPDRTLRDDHLIPTDDGWRLHLKRTRDPATLREDRRPLLIVPGYGMNGFIFGFHPHGTSMERCLAEEGFEVWTLDMRGQGGSVAARGSAEPPSLRAYAEVDLTVAIRAILELTDTDADRVDPLGASLGGSVVYAHMALCPDHRVGAVIAIGAPLRWVKVHPLLRLAFTSPWLASLVSFDSTEKLARVALPLLARHAPWALSPYMNTSLVDLSAAREMTRTVDKLQPRVNRDIAKWVSAGDMVLGGVNVTDAMRRVEVPLLLLLANRDGIVPTASACSAEQAWGGADIERLEIGDDRQWYAHADLYVGNDAPQVVFEPIACWLEARN